MPWLLLLAPTPHHLLPLQSIWHHKQDQYGMPFSIVWPCGKMQQIEVEGKIQTYSWDGVTSVRKRRALLILSLRKKEACFLMLSRSTFPRPTFSPMFPKRSILIILSNLLFSQFARLHKCLLPRSVAPPSCNSCKSSKPLPLPSHYHHSIIQHHIFPSSKPRWTQPHLMVYSNICTLMHRINNSRSNMQLCFNRPSSNKLFNHKRLCWYNFAIHLIYQTRTYASCHCGLRDS